MGGNVSNNYGTNLMAEDFRLMTYDFYALDGRHCGQGSLGQLGTPFGGHLKLRIMGFGQHRGSG